MSGANFHWAQNGAGPSTSEEVRLEKSSRVPVWKPKRRSIRKAKQSSQYTSKISRPISKIEAAEGAGMKSSNEVVLLKKEQAALKTDLRLLKALILTANDEIANHRMEIKELKLELNAQKERLLKMEWCVPERPKSRIPRVC